MVILYQDIVLNISFQAKKEIRYINKNESIILMNKNFIRT